MKSAEAAPHNCAAAEWTYTIHLQGCTVYSHYLIIQQFQNKVLKKVTAAPWYISMDHLHEDLIILDDKQPLMNSTFTSIPIGWPCNCYKSENTIGCGGSIPIMSCSTSTLKGRFKKAQQSYTLINLSFINLQILVNDHDVMSVLLLNELEREEEEKWYIMAKQPIASIIVLVRK